MNHPAYNSEELGLFTAVLDQVCIDLRILDQAHRDTIGNRILHKASTGKRNFQVLRVYGSLESPGERFTKLRPGSIQVPYRFSMIDPA